ncbi:MULTISPECIES: potassium channel family protein [Flavobacterium]|uniref:Two pore domain potassium channel family protein n=1 Tax=Flavobacterium gawalongense TaxID=2594432 RepID=A0A553BG64_9FLAO|nr:potassium channel family protein [Flavobacterium gawalongense]TRW99897.1 two pore domain potassium channel family protein [Flavobacterium gawalongense]TRX04361.1 two pore domain potassium channel family protein [Flavobacterium gawalongense]TRX07250.1 two pore domain potassium channel family protein [Flavobacterium gawalongense]TRX08001.1 two pore domain potassium channel family protein [Flavobacterium gawalongense]TRX24253.1 two pore domain potassium channel family protein [Flavobacterium g
MKKIIKKLLLGNVPIVAKPKINPVEKRVQNIKAIWNNDHQDDNGIEKIVRLFLSSSQLLFPGIYIKYLASRKGVEYQDLAIDFYVLLKVIFPLVTLINQWQTNGFVIVILIYVLLETVLYIPTLIFASDLFSKPRSYKRSMLLLFLNYVEIVLAFGVLYSCDNFMNKPFTHWFDAVYFSTITSSSIGYGDFYPVTTLGKVLVSIQALLFLFFVVLFLNFFSTKIKTKGYFDFENEG